MAFKKYFYIVIASYVLLFLTSPAFAGWETVDILDFGVIEVRQTTNVNMSYSGSISGSNSIISHSGWHNGTSRYTNNGNSKVKISHSNTQSDAPLTCVTNCSVGTSCDVYVTRFRFSRSVANIQAGASFDWNIGAQIAIPEGVFEGTAYLEATVDNESQTYPLAVKIVIGDLPAISVIPQDELDFGDILSTTASTVTVGTNGSRTCSPASVCVGNQSSRGSFRVESSSSTAQTISVDCPSGAVQMGNGSNFYIDSFICSTSSNSVSSSAPATVNVGATLHVPQGQASGEYNTTYTITVNN